MADHGTRRVSPLRTHRQARLLTQHDVAEHIERLAWAEHRKRVGINADMVSKWERGLKRPSAFYQQLMCVLFDATPGQLGFAPPASSLEPIASRAGDGVAAALELLDSVPGPVELLHPNLQKIWRKDVLGRRDLLKVMGVAPAALRVEALETSLFMHPATQPQFKGWETVQQLETLAHGLETAYFSSPSERILLPVRALSQTAEDWLGHPKNSRIRAGLLRVLSRAHLLWGRLCFFDLNRPMDARAHLDVAREAAIEASDSALVAAALGHLAFLPAEHRQFAAAFAYLSGARDAVASHSLNEILAWLEAVRAEVETKAGQNAVALKAIDRSKKFLSASQGRTPAWFDFFDERRLAGFEGYALRRAGDTPGARSCLDRALACGSQQGSKQRAVSMIDLGVVCVEEGDLETGCELATDAIVVLREAGYAKAVDRLHELRLALPDATHPAARLLRDAAVELS